MADRPPIVIGSDIIAEEIKSTDRLDLPGLVMSGEADLSSNKVVNLADGTNPLDAVNLIQLETFIQAALDSLIFTTQGGVVLDNSGKPVLLS